MQNNLFTINNEERNRILNLHESRSKSQYLDSLKQDINTLSSKIDETYFLGVSPDEKIFFTNKNIYVNEGDELKKLEYDLDSLPYILETARKKCDKMLIEGNITLNKYLSVPQKFLMSLMEEWGVNHGVKQEINEHWNDKFKGSIKLLTENRKLIFENGLNHQLWEEVNLIANQVILEQAWNPFSKDFVVYKGAKAVGSAIGQGANWALDKAKKVGSAAWEGIKQVGNAVYQGGKWIIKGISKAAGKLLNWVLKKGIIPALRWIRRNLHSYIGMITEIIASMFPTVVVVKAIWCLIVILDIYEILNDDYDPYDPERKQMPFLFLMTDILSLFMTAAAGFIAKKLFKTAAKDVAKGAIMNPQAKSYLTTIFKSLPKLSGTLKYVQDILTTWFGKSVGGVLGKVFGGINTIVSKLGTWIKTTFKIGETAAELATKQGMTKLATGTVMGLGFAEFFKEKSLRKGMTSDLVKQAQNGLLLTKKTSYPQLQFDGPADGVFGEQTEKAVKQLQEYLKLPVNGVIDPRIGMVLGVDFGPGNLEKLVGAENMKTLGDKLMATNKWLDATFGSTKGALK